jgi:hypothetical protein
MSSLSTTFKLRWTFQFKVAKLVGLPGKVHRIVYVQERWMLIFYVLGEAVSLFLTLLETHWPIYFWVACLFAGKLQKEKRSYAYLEKKNTHLANFLLLYRLFKHLQVQTSMIVNQRSALVEYIARKSLICLILTFLVNLLMNLLKITNFLGDRSDVSKVLQLWNSTSRCTVS